MSEAGEEQRPSQVDARMADILAAADATERTRARRDLRDENSDDAEDLLSRLNVLDYLDEVVGQAGGSELPEKLGDYRITGLLGRGGMGTVFQAFQESLERQVALKVLSPTFTANPKMRRRFRIEARASASLHHQHIVPVYGFGETAGYLYFTMELVEGVSLDKHIEKARRIEGVALPPLEAARRFAGVADALSHAHRRGILHRDVKPGNILVHEDGELALADFGLSKMVNEASMSLSRTGGFLGTLHYTAPEQAKGGEVGPASDLYGLGVTMFEAMTGRLPLRGKTTEAMLKAILHEDAVRLRDVLPKVPRNLDAVLRKLLSKEPSDRYQDGEALARDLLRVADGEPVRIRRESLAVRAWRQVRKHPALSAAIFAASLLFFLSTGLFISNERQRRDSQYSERVNAAMAEAETGLGPVDGPGVLFRFLAGFDVRGVDTPIQFRELLEQAQRLESGNEQPTAMLAAYAEDPLPAASSDMLAGLGFDALQKLEQRIRDQQADQGLAGRDNAQRLQLYNLFLARGVAAASAPVARSEAAVRDLLRASFLRPGAFFPRALTAILDWEPDNGMARLRGELDPLLEEAPVGGRQVIGGLLVAFAGLDRPLEADLLVSDAPAEDRLAMHRWGVELLGRGLPDRRDRRRGQLDRDLSFALTDGLTSTDPAELSRVLKRGDDLLQRVAADSALRCWQPVFRYLENGEEGFEQDTSRLLDKRRGLDRLTRLVLEHGDEVTRRRVLQDVERLAGLELVGGDEDEAVQVYLHRVRTMALTARIESGFTGATPLQPRAYADAWVAAEPGNADAYFWRMRACLLAKQMDEAQFNAVLASQKAPDPAAMRRAIAQALEPHDAKLARSFEFSQRGQ